MMGRRFARWAWALAFAAVIAPTEPCVAQVETATVSASTTSAARPAAPPPPSPPRRRSAPRRPTRRRRRPVSMRIEPPTAENRRAEPQPWRPLSVRVEPRAARTAKPPRVLPPLSALGPFWNQALSEALWAVLWVLVLALISLRVLAWLVRRLARRGVRAAMLAERGWRLIEGLTWLGISVWILDRLASGPGVGPAAVALGGVALVVSLGFNAIRDVVVGLLLNLERPFQVGDYVRVAEAEGQVHAFRTRVVELIAPDGHRLFVPYRALAGTTDVRPGGRRRAYAVRVRLPVPEGMDPSEALGLAEEVSRASPWTTLASDPRLILVEKPSMAIDVEAFAFHADAQSLLHAEILKSWAGVSRRRAS